MNFDPSKHLNKEGEGSDVVFFSMIAVDVIIYLSSLYSMIVFISYVFKTHSKKPNAELLDRYDSRQKLVTAINLIIIKDFTHTIYLVISLIYSLGFMAYFAVPIPLVIQATKFGYWCYWRSSYVAYAKLKEND